VNPVICDFGLAKFIKKPGEFDLSSVSVKGMKDISAVGISYRYAAPEAFNRMYQKQGLVDEAKPVDVYAYAVMVWELLERKVPFHKSSNREVEGKVKMGERPFISPQYKDPSKPFENNKHYSVLLKVIEATWKQDPRERPSFEELKQKLKAFWLGAPEVRDAESAKTPRMDGLPPTESPFYTNNVQNK
jgi:serine/threonine protein kinase